MKVESKFDKRTEGVVKLSISTKEGHVTQLYYEFDLLNGKVAGVHGYEVSFEVFFNSNDYLEWSSLYRQLASLGVFASRAQKLVTGIKKRISALRNAVLVAEGREILGQGNVAVAEVVGGCVTETFDNGVSEVSEVHCVVG